MYIQVYIIQLNMTFPIKPVFLNTQVTSHKYEDTSNY